MTAGWRAQHGAAAFERFDALLDHCEAVAFAVPPDVQADLAVRAARAGKALLLEKPLALDLAAALGPVMGVRASGDLRGGVGPLLETARADLLRRR